MTDDIDHPTHYNSRDIGCECIDITQHQTFCTGNAIKYLWRYRYKGKPLEDLKKARWYAERALALHEPVNSGTGHCEAVLRSLASSTTGPEQSAWISLTLNDWRKTLDALDKMIKEIQSEPQVN